MANNRSGILLGWHPLILYSIIFMVVMMISYATCGGSSKSKKKEPKQLTELHEKYTFLVNKYEPKKISEGAKIYKFNGRRTTKMDLVTNEIGFGGIRLIENDEYVTFDIEGDYETLTFTMGHSNCRSKERGIVTVNADGKKILDEIVVGYVPPRAYSLNVSGVKELTFAVADGYIDVVFSTILLWKKGETPVDVRSVPEPITKPIELVKDMKPYYLSNFMRAITEESDDTIRLNGKKFNYGLIGDMEMALIGKYDGAAYFHLRKQFSKLSFIAGCTDDLIKGAGTGWITVKTDDKTIEEIEIKEGDIARQVVLDISGCEYLSIHSEQATGGSHAGIAEIMVYPEEKDVPAHIKQNGLIPPAPRLKELPDVCKLISNIPPYQVIGTTSKQIYDNSSEHLTFSMGGYKFSEGIILYQTTSLLDDNTSACATFDVGNEFDYISFTTGYLGKSWNMNDDLLMVYADDKLIYSTPLIATYPNKQHVVPINKCRKLSFTNRGCGRMDVAAFGITDIVAYRGEPVENDLFVHPTPDLPHEADLIDLGRPYIHYVSTMHDHKDEILFDGSTKKRYFEMNGERIYKGFMLQTSTHFSLDFGVLGDKGENATGSILGAAALGASFVASGVAIGGISIGATVAPLGALLMLAAGGEAVENSMAAFNTYKEYNSVTFKVGCLPKAGVKSTEPEHLMIGADHNVMANIALYEEMEPMEFTVPIDGCEQLIFWLVNSGGNSAKYMIYDIVVSKDKLPLSIPEAAKMPLPATEKADE